MARCGNRPAAVEVRYGDGAFIVSLSPFCLSDHAPEIAIDNVPNLEIPNPRPLLQHVRVLLDRYLKEERIFTVGDGLGYTVCRKDERRYIVAIYNNGFEAKEISLRCQCGEIAAIDELLLDQSEKNAVGYRPRPFQDREYAKEGADTLSAGDIRIFDVKITKEKVHVLQEMPEEATPAQRYLRIDTESGLQQSIRNKPTLYDYFSGVEIDWRYLDNRDLDAIRNEGRWLQRQSFEVIIDFSSGCNIFPDLAYLDSAGIPYYETLERVETLFRKAATLSTSRCILSLHRAPNVWSEERLWNTFLAGMHEVCRRADEHGITVLLQHHHAKWPGKSENVAEFIRSAKVNNLKFALNLSHCMLTGENPENLMAGSLDILGAVLLSVPETDAYGQRYDAHLPAYRFAEEMAAPILASHAADHDIPLVLDASYSSWDDVYRDVRFLGLAGE